MAFVKTALVAIVYFALVAFVVGAIYAGYVLDLGIALFGVSVPPEIYLFVLAVVAWKAQTILAHTFVGAGRTLDVTISLPMLVVVGYAVLSWAGVPIGNIFGIVTPAPDVYRLTVAILFGVVAVYDVLIRDLFGFGRSRRTGAAGTGGRVNRANLVSGAHGDLPDATEELSSRSGAPLYRVTGDAVIDIQRWLIRDPFSGELVEVAQPPARAAARVIDHVANSPRTLSAPAAAPATPTPAPAASAAPHAPAAAPAVPPAAGGS